MARWRHRQRFYREPWWPRYVPVTERRDKAARHVSRLRKQGHETRPVVIEGRAIASSFWGRSWCETLEGYGDFANRFPRGRTYVRNGSVIHLEIGAGMVDALVSGSDIYAVEVRIRPLAPARWKSLVADCAGRVGSLIELLQGRFSRDVMEALVRSGSGLFPSPKEISFTCSCPDAAGMCKHIAATLYGVGARFDEEPELFFLLRQVDGSDLVEAAGVSPVLRGSPAPAVTLKDDLSSVFDIDLDDTPAAAAPARGPGPVPAKARVPARRRRPERAAPSDDDRPAIDVLFEAGTLLRSRDLQAFGVPRTAVARWVTTGVLARSGRRGIYVATEATAERIRRVLMRQRRSAESG